LKSPPVERLNTSISEDCFWLRGAAGQPLPPLRGETRADVAIIGGGLTGLWTAIRLHETDASLRIFVLEQARVAYGASGRNAGYVDASLTHGLVNGARLFPDEWQILDREGVENLRQTVAFIRAAGIDCDLEETGRMTVASAPYQVDELGQMAEFAARAGVPLRYLDRAEVEGEIRAGSWLAGLFTPPERAVSVDPAKLCRGLAVHATGLGIEIHEQTGVSRLERLSNGVRVHCAEGSVVADRVVIASGAYSGWLPSLRPRFIPLFDYALVSAPLQPEQLAQLGWRQRVPLRDAWNWFHYFRLTPDDRLLWGGYQAVYYRGSRVEPSYDVSPSAFRVLEQHLHQTFPELAGVGIDFRWGGPIDSTARFAMTFPSMLGGRVVGAIGYTGLGLAASRWAAGIVRDMILRPESDLLRLRIVRSRPVPFPPEPFRSLAFEATRSQLARADSHEGRRGVLLRVMDRLGIGIAS
jgi:glycine/D-amino acid oxidase-like deaminating enzyme